MIGWVRPKGGRIRLGAVLSAREKALRNLHVRYAGDRGGLRAILRNHRGRYPRTERGRDLVRVCAVNEEKRRKLARKRRRATAA